MALNRMALSQLFKEESAFFSKQLEFVKKEDMGGFKNSIKSLSASDASKLFAYVVTFPGQGIPFAEALLATGKVRVDFVHKQDGTKPFTALKLAVQMNNTACVDFLIRNGANVNLSLSNGNTELHRAASNAFPEIVQLLLNAGANPNVVSHDGYLPLHYAVLVDGERVKSLNGEQLHDLLERKRKITEMLLTASPGTINIKHSGYTVLHYAAIYGFEDIVRLLVERGADKETIDDQSGDTPLLSAVRLERPGIVEILLENRVNIEARDVHDNTPLMLAITHEFSAIIGLLLMAGADVNCTCNGVNPLHLAASNMNPGLVRQLLNAGANPNSTTTFFSSEEAKALDVALLANARLFASRPDDGNNAALHNYEDKRARIGKIIEILGSVTEHVNAVSRNQVAAAAARLASVAPPNITLPTHHLQPPTVRSGHNLVHNLRLLQMPKESKKRKRNISHRRRRFSRQTRRH